MANKGKQGIKDDSLQKLIKRANQKIFRIEKRYGKDRWAVKKLKSNLDNDLLNAWTEKGRIRIPKNASEDDLEKIKLITEKFVTKEQSSLRSIAKIEARTKEAIRNKTSLSSKPNEQIVNKLSNEDVELIYDALDDDNIQWLMDEARIGSDVWVFIAEAKDKRETKDQFVDRVSLYIKRTNDLEVKERLESIFSDFVDKKD